MKDALATGSIQHVYSWCGNDAVRFVPSLSEHLRDVEYIHSILRLRIPAYISTKHPIYKVQPDASLAHQSAAHQHDASIPPHHCCLHLCSLCSQRRRAPSSHACDAPVDLLSPSEQSYPLSYRVLAQSAMVRRLLASFTSLYVSLLAW